MNTSDISHTIVWFAGATHRPVIRLATDDHLIKPYVVWDIGRGLQSNPFFQSRHKSDYAARRAINQYRRLTEYHSAREQAV